MLQQYDYKRESCIVADRLNEKPQWAAVMRNITAEYDGLLWCCGWSSDSVPRTSNQCGFSQKKTIPGLNIYSAEFNGTALDLTGGIMW
jgi:hypothetical protein